METGIIYRATAPNGKVYIGQTVSSLTRRKSRHFSDATKNTTKFAIAIKEFESQLVWEVIHDNVSIDALDELEISEVTKHNSFFDGYNSTPGGGNGGFQGRQHSEGTKMLLSQQKQGLNNPMYGKKGSANPFFGKKHTAETRVQISNSHADVAGPKNPMFGKPNAHKKHKEDTKLKMSKERQGSANPFFGKKHTAETKQKMREAAARRKLC